MKLTDVYMNALAVNSDLSAAAPKMSADRKSEGSSFDDFFNKTASQEYDNGVNESRTQETKKFGTKKKDTTVEKKVNETVKEKEEIKEPEKVTDKEIEKEDEKEVSETAGTKEVTAAEDKSKDEEAEAKLIQEIADVLEIPKEVLQQLLADLNMKPADLLVQGNLNKFLQEALSVDSPIELLQIPNMKEMLSEIRQALSDFADKTEKVTLTATVKTEEVATAETTTKNESGSSVLKSAVEVDKEGKRSDAKETPQEKPVTAKVTETATATDSSATKNSFGSAGGNAKNNSFTFSNSENNAVNAQAASRQTAAATEFTSTLVKAESTRNLNPSDIIRQMTDSMKSNVREGVTEVRMVLKPESLGEVTLKVMVQNGVVTAEFLAKSERIKEIIESNFNSLKDTLLQQGISVSELSVSVDNQDSNGPMDQYTKERRKSHARISQIIGAINSEEAMAEINQSEILENEVDYMA